MCFITRGGSKGASSRPALCPGCLPGRGLHRYIVSLHGVIPEGEILPHRSAEPGAGLGEVRHSFRSPRPGACGRPPESPAPVDGLGGFCMSRRQPRRGGVSSRRHGLWSRAAWSVHGGNVSALCCCCVTSIPELDTRLLRPGFRGQFGCGPAAPRFGAGALLTGGWHLGCGAVGTAGRSQDLHPCGLSRASWHVTMSPSLMAGGRDTPPVGSEGPPMSPRQCVPRGDGHPSLGLLWGLNEGVHETPRLV